MIKGSLLLAFMILTACSSRYDHIRWTGGQSGANMQEDIENCEKKGEADAQRYSSRVSQRSYAEQTFRSCMRSRGYREMDRLEGASTQP